MNAKQRQVLLHDLFQAGIEAVGGRQATRRELGRHVLADRVHLVAVGKAADAMAGGAIECIGNKLVSGLVVTKHDHLSEEIAAHPDIECHESGHPVPDAASLRAGRRLCDYLAAIPADEQLVFLVSGGASALVEYLNTGLTLGDLKAQTDILLASGAAIGEMNRHRRTLSRIKGGKLAAQVNCEVLQLLISDVPGDRIEDIGSGLLVPDSSCGMPPSLPVWQKISTYIIASSSIAQSAVAEAARQQGLTVCQSSGNLDGDITAVTERIKSVLCAEGAPAGIYIWGGEPTLVLPQSTGRGGRNQHLALSLARPVAALEAACVLVCGTDGTDGPTKDAGGVVCESTLDKCTQMGLDIDDYLDRADSGTALQALDALVTTGPTGTNVMDLAIALRE